MRYLLDTNILLALLRGGPLGQYVRGTYRFAASDPTPLISVATEAEIRSLGLSFKWGLHRRTDRDLDHLHSAFLERELISPDSRL